MPELSRQAVIAFIDTNILLKLLAFDKQPMLQILTKAYEKIYIHQAVLDEILTNEDKMKVQEFIKNEQWFLFDPEDTSCLTEEEWEIYNEYIEKITDTFSEIDTHKSSSNIGEIHCLAAASMVNAEIICSNDYSIQKVIDKLQLEIHQGSEAIILIQSHTLLDFCKILHAKQLLKRAEIRQFFSACFKEYRTSKYTWKREQYKKYLKEFANEVPIEE